MNSLKGLGVCIVLGCMVFAMSQVAKVDQVVLGVTVSITAISILTWVAAVRRYRRDRRMAGVRRR